MLEVKRVWSPDIPDGESLPENPSNCSVLIQADIGRADEKAADTFNFEVWTPAAIAARLERDSRAYWSRSTLVMPVFSWDEVERALNQLVRGFEAPTWEQSAEKLNRYLHWEFEDYQPRA